MHLNKMKRGVALLLACAVLFGVCPITVRADEGTEPEGDIICVIEVTVVEVPAGTGTETTENAPAPETEEPAETPAPEEAHAEEEHPAEEPTIEEPAEAPAAEEAPAEAETPAAEPETEEPTEAPAAEEAPAEEELPAAEPAIEEPAEASAAEEAPAEEDTPAEEPTIEEPAEAPAAEEAPAEAETPADEELPAAEPESEEPAEAPEAEDACNEEEPEPDPTAEGTVPGTGEPGLRDGRLVGDVACTLTASGTYTAAFTVERYDPKTGKYKQYRYTVTGFNDITSAEEYAVAVCTASLKTDITVSGDLTDAEKLVSATGDSNLCWAASCADMLVLSGWADGPESVTFATEDELFDYYMGRFTNAPSMQQAGLIWFFSGVNLYQNYVSQSVAKLRGGYTDADGFLRAYCPEDMITLYDSVDDSAIGAALGSLTGDADGDACALGIIFGFYNSITGARNGGHAVTVTGYATDESGKYCELIVADSDNSMLPGGTDRTVYDNTYTAYRLVKENGVWALADALDNRTGYSYAIDSICTLKNYSESTADRVEQGGTTDAVHFPDLVVESIKLSVGNKTGVTKVYTDETLSANVVLENHGAVRYRADVPLTFVVCKDGEEVRRVDSTTGAISLSTAGIYRINELIADTTDRLSPGSYTIVCVADPDRTVSEAYYNNNTSCLLTFTVLRRTEEGNRKSILIVPDRDGLCSPADGGAYSVFVYRAPAAPDRVFYLPDQDAVPYGNRVPLNASEYSVVRENGRYIISFSESFLQTLPQGVNSFEVTVGHDTYRFSFTVA